MVMRLNMCVVRVEKLLVLLLFVPERPGPVRGNHPCWLLPNKQRCRLPADLDYLTTLDLLLPYTPANSLGRERRQVLLRTAVAQQLDGAARIVPI